ncbi:MAG: reverse transcriptase domain-containing protein [Gammaproteobacteria bacterium]
MRDAETILSIIRDRGRRGLPLERVYRLLFNPNLYLKAYGKIYRNAGALTPGTTEETADGMSLAKIGAIIDALRHERYRWRPARRVYIEKKHSNKKRPLGLPTWSDKLLQEAIRLILEAYFEPQFSDYSHGFRPGRGCHTALMEIKKTWNGTVWFIEGDISDCFGSVDHDILLGILGEKIHDGRFLRLIGNLLKAGYMEYWRHNATLSGTPQGGIVSPILSNIYLDRLDKYVEKSLLSTHNRKAERRHNQQYLKRMNRANYLEFRKGRRDEAKRLRKETRTMPSRDPDDPDYRRLKYVRYADDFILGFIGPRQEAEGIKHQLKEFLRDDLKLKLSGAKTLVTHGRSQAARFLGYEIVTLHDNGKRNRKGRTINGVIGLKVPEDVVRSKCAPYQRNGKPQSRPERLYDDAFSIVAGYQLEYQGIVEYYRLAYNLSTKLKKLKWVMETSLTKTLSSKFQISVSKVYDRYGTTIQTDRGSYKVLQVVVDRGQDKKPLVAQWGGVTLAWNREAVLNDQPIAAWNKTRTELLQRLLADTCELCGSKENVEVHHVRALKDLQRRGRAEKPEWVKQMASRQRKTLIVCHRCHTDIHTGKGKRSKAPTNG